MHIGSVVYANQKYGAPSAAAAALLPLERTHGTHYNNNSTWPENDRVAGTRYFFFAATPKAKAWRT